MVEKQQCSRGCLDTADCLEAVRVFKRWKTLLLLVVALCLLVLQGAFHLVDRGCIKIAIEDHGNNPDAAEQANPVREVLGKWLPVGSISEIRFEQLAWTIDLLNAIIVLAITLYCLTLLFSLNVSLQGRLGGINHISRAFVLSLIVLVLVLPWQRVFGSVVTGAVFTPEELARWYSSKTEDTLKIVTYYLRFVGYGVSIFLLLILSDLSSLLWAKAIIRRLTVTEVGWCSVHQPSRQAEGPGAVEILGGPRLEYSFRDVGTASVGVLEAFCEVDAPKLMGSLLASGLGEKSGQILDPEPLISSLEALSRVIRGESDEGYLIFRILVDSTEPSTGRCYRRMKRLQPYRRDVVSA